MKKSILSKCLLIFFILSGTISFAQNRIEGEVIDTRSKDVLPGASVIIKGTNKGVTSDFYGKYSLSSDIAFPWVLEISYIGFKTKEVTVESNSSLLTLSLDEDNSKLDEVIITANKRSQSVQKTAMSVSVLSPLKLERLGAEEFEDYANGIPNVAFSPSGDGNTGRASSNVAIRGISGSNTTAMYLNQTPLPENINIRLLDVSRVEVLKGPQGTLYGSRNMGGAVKTIVNNPNVGGFAGSIKGNFASVTEGDQDYNIEGIINIPFSDKIALRVGGFYDYETGIFDTKIDKKATVVNKKSVVTLTDGTSTININTDGCKLCSEIDKKNIDDKNQFGLNLSLGFFPSENISIIPRVIIQDLKGDGYDFAESEVGTFIKEGNFNQLRASGIPESFSDKWNFYSLIFEIDTNAGKIISSTSYLDRDIFEKEDTGEITFRLFDFWDRIWNPSTNAYNTWAMYMSRAVEESQFNQEVRFQSDFGNKFEFTAGAFYIDNKFNSDWNSEENATGLVSYITAFQYDDYVEAERQNNASSYPLYIYTGRDKSSELALFGEFYYNITPKLKATVGLRYFNAEASRDILDYGYSVYDGETLNADGTPNYESSRTVIKGDQKESGVNPKYNLTYEITDNQLMYVTAAKGFRLGGVNDVVNMFLSSDELISLGYADGKQPATYKSDYLWNYEIGYKGKTLNGKLLANIALFYNDWQNLQQAKALTSGYSFISNLGSARSYGFELEVRAKLSDEIALAGGYGYLNAELSEDVSTLGATKGDKILGTAPHTANISLNYDKFISDTKAIYSIIGFQYVGERLGSFAPETDPHLIFGGYSILNARIGMQLKDYNFSIFGNNLTNTFANYGTPNAFSGDLTQRPRYATNRPITVGVSAGWRF